MKKTLLLLAIAGFIVVNACQSTKSESTEAAVDSTAVEQAVEVMEETAPADSTASADSTATVESDSIQ